MAYCIDFSCRREPRRIDIFWVLKIVSTLPPKCGGEVYIFLHIYSKIFMRNSCISILFSPYPTWFSYIVAQIASYTCFRSCTSMLGIHKPASKLSNSRSDCYLVTTLISNFCKGHAFVCPFHSVGAPELL